MTTPKTDPDPIEVLPYPEGIDDRDSYEGEQVQAELAKAVKP